MKRTFAALALAAFVTPALADDLPEPPKLAKDSEFIKTAACGGDLEIKLAELAVKQAESPEVKQFAEKMIADHTKAGKKLKEVALKSGVELPKELDEKHEAVCRKLKNIESASFDREYMTCMVKDHKEAIALFEKGAASENADIKAFASATLPTIKEHAKMAKEIAVKVGADIHHDHDGKDSKTKKNNK